MTNMPVLDKGSGVRNILSGKGTKPAESSKGGLFDTVLRQTTEAGKQEAASGQKAENVKTLEAKPKTQEPMQQDSVNENGKIEESAGTQETQGQEETTETTEITEITETKEVLEETKDVPEEVQDVTDSAEVLEKAGGEMVAALAAQMGITQETVREAMDELNMTDVSLLEPKNVKKLMVHLTEGADDMSLLTDENLYASVAEALDTLDGIVSKVQDETGMTLQEFEAAVLNAEKQFLEKEISEKQPVKEQLAESQSPVIENQPADVKEPETAGKTQGASKEAQEVSTETQKASTEAQGASIKAQEAPTEVQKALTENSQEIEKDNTVKLNSTKPELSENARTETVVPKETFKQESHEKGSESPFMQNGYQTQNLERQVEVLRAAETELTYSTVDTQEIMDQILDQMKISVKPEMTSVEMQLHPASLGNLHIHITNREGAVAAQFIAQNESVKAALESQVMELKANLEQQGIKVEAVEVTIAQYSLDRNPEGSETASGESKRQKKGGRNLNLDELDLEDEELTEEERLTAEVMRQTGSTINYTA